MKKWKCTVCGYIHEGEQPPEKCPVCGADKSLFILLEEEKRPATKIGENKEPVDTQQSDTRNFQPAIYDLVLKQHLHPISVHIPNGVLPITVLFAGIAVLFKSEFFRHAATANMVVVFLSMPLVIFSGYVVWKIKFRGNLSKIFLTKIICAAIVTSISFAIAVWWIMDPQIMASSIGKKILFIFLNILNLGAAGTAGFLGGKLVFSED